MLQRGADVTGNQQGGSYGSALQAAAASCEAACVQLLLEHGAEVNAKGGEYGIALQAACAPHTSFRFPYGDEHTQSARDEPARLSSHGLDYGRGAPLARPWSRRSHPRRPLRKRVARRSDHAHPLFQLARSHAASPRPRRRYQRRRGGDASYAHSATRGAPHNQKVGRSQEDRLPPCPRRRPGSPCRHVWDIVEVLPEAGAEPNCWSLDVADEGWLARVGGWPRCSGAV